MAYMLYGAAGALVVLLLVLGGGLAGWKLRGRLMPKSGPTAEDPGEAARRRVQEERRAFQQLQGYSAETAYGMMNGPSLTLERPGGEDG